MFFRLRRSQYFPSREFKNVQFWEFFWLQSIPFLIYNFASFSRCLCAYNGKVFKCNVFQSIIADYFFKIRLHFLLMTWVGSANIHQKCCYQKDYFFVISPETAILINFFSHVLWIWDVSAWNGLISDVRCLRYFESIGVS